MEPNFINGFKCDTFQYFPSVVCSLFAEGISADILVFYVYYLFFLHSPTEFVFILSIFYKATPYTFSSCIAVMIIEQL